MLLSLHISGWLAPCGVSLISRITGSRGSHRIRVRGSGAFFPPYPLFFKDHRSVSSSSPSLFLSVHLSLVSLLPRCHAGSLSLTSCQGIYMRVHPEICRRDLNKGWFIPRWLPFQLSDALSDLKLGKLRVSFGYFSSPDEYFIVHRTFRQDGLICLQRIVFTSHKLVTLPHKKKHLLDVTLSCV